MRQHAQVTFQGPPPKHTLAHTYTRARPHVLVSQKCRREELLMALRCKNNALHQCRSGSPSFATRLLYQLKVANYRNPFHNSLQLRRIMKLRNPLPMNSCIEVADVPTDKEWVRVCVCVSVWVG